MRPVTAHTRLVGLIGWPVGHSVSPLMHNAAFAALDMDWRYLPFPVPAAPAGRVVEAVLGLRALGMRGANVTVPHKQAVIPSLHVLTPAAEAIGAVNTICVQEDGTLLGDNTDARGFIADLRDHELNPEGKNALVLGAGGSARAVAFGLAEAAASRITVLNRTEARAQELVRSMSAYYPDCTWMCGPSSDPEVLQTHAVCADLIVNCTSLGMEPDIASMPWDRNVPIMPEQAVYDLVYNPEPTRLVSYASECGATAANGKGMLVWQGAFSFELWTGVPAPVEVMRQAIGD